MWVHRVYIGVLWILTVTYFKLPPSDLEVLSAGIMALGGQWRHGLTKDVTHLFATTSGSDKYNGAFHHKEHTNIKILLPHWFDDVVKLGTATLDTAPYEWPDPAYLKSPLLPVQWTPKKLRKMNADQKALLKTAGWSPGSEIPNVPVKEIWNNKRLLLSTTLELTSGRRESVRIGVERAAGVIVEYNSNNGDGTMEEELEKIDECDIYVTRYRSGPAYRKVCAYISRSTPVLITIIPLGCTCGKNCWHSLLGLSRPVNWHVFQTHVSTTALSPPQQTCKR